MESTSGNGASGELWRVVGHRLPVLIELLEFESEHVQPAFEFSHAGFERFLRRARRLLEQHVDCRSSHFGDTPDALRKAKFAELFVFFRG